MSDQYCTPMTARLVRRRFTIAKVIRHIRLEPVFWNALEVFSKAQGWTPKEQITRWWETSPQGDIVESISFSRIIRCKIMQWYVEERDKHRSRLPTERPWRPR